MTATRKRKVLAEGFEVEWCVSIPTDECGDSLHDDADFRFADFATEAEAMAHAAAVFPLDQYGSVRVTKFHTEPYENGRPGSFREYDSDPVYFEGQS
jgi:hypothetical protein